MRFIGHIFKGSQEIARASVMNTEDETPDSVASRANASLVRDIKRNHSRMYQASSEAERVSLAAFTLLQTQFEECIKKTMAHGKDALVSVHVRGKK